MVVISSSFMPDMRSALSSRNACLRFSQVSKRPEPIRDSAPLLASVPGQCYVFNPAVSDTHCVYRIARPKDKRGVGYTLNRKLVEVTKSLLARLDSQFGTSFFNAARAVGRRHASNFSAELVSGLGYAPLGADGKLNTQSPYLPWIKPTQEDLERFPNGFEDPRLVKIEDVYYILCSATHQKKMIPVSDLSIPIEGAKIYLFSTRDFQSYTRHGVIGPDFHNRNASFFPTKLIDPSDGQSKILMLLKRNPGIAYAFLPELDRFKDNAFRTDFWEKIRHDDQSTLMTPLFPWESDHIALSQTPILTAEGWLIIYHAKDDLNVYRMGMALLDTNDPTLVLHRSPDPLMAPQLPIERTEGLVRNVIFPTGGRVVDMETPSGQPYKELQIYYGAGDAQIRRAHFGLNDLLGYLVQFDGQGMPLSQEVIFPMTG